MATAGGVVDGGMAVTSLAGVGAPTKNVKGVEASASSSGGGTPGGTVFCVALLGTGGTPSPESLVAPRAGGTTTTVPAAGGPGAAGTSPGVGNAGPGGPTTTSSATEVSGASNGLYGM